MAKQLERGAKFLVEKSKNDSETNEDVAGVFLALIRRTFDVDDFNINKLYNLTVANLNELEERKSALKIALPNIYRYHWLEIDREFVDNIENKYKFKL